MNKIDTKTIIIQKDDIKSKKWAEASTFVGLNVVIQKKSAIYAPWFLLKFILGFGKPSGYVIRYLNDYQSFLRTMVRTLSEISLVMICWVFRIKIFWICHNVDKETERYFPSISNFRRKLVSRCCKRILVTDVLLKDKAAQLFPRYHNKIDSISFGEIAGYDTGSGDKESIRFLAQKRDAAVQGGIKFLSVLCAGSPNNPKYLHFSYLIDLIEKAKINGYYIAAIVAGNWDDSERSNRLLNAYKTSPNILVFEKFTTFSSSFIKSNMDFYFRGYDDYSVPFTVYEACALRKPILALESGFLPKMVRHYDIGNVVDRDLRNIDKSLAELCNVMD